MSLGIHYIRDVLELADPRSLLTGIRLLNILGDNLVSHIYQTTYGIDQTMYNAYIPLFLETCRRSIIRLSSAKDNLVTMTIRIEITFAFKHDIIPTYTVHQIGIISLSGGPCSKLVLLKTLAHKNSTFYEVDCQTT